MTYWLTGQLGTELTNASTTGLLDPRTMTWSAAVADALGVPTGLFPRFRTAGELAGPLSRRVTADLGLARPPHVVIGPSHDTAAAVAASRLPRTTRSPTSAPGRGRWSASS